MKKQLILLGILLAACLGLLGWAGYTFLPDAADTYQREIVNDDYSTLTAPLTAKGEIRQQITVKGRVYGVILDVTTFERVARGTLHLGLYTPDGTLAASCDTDMTQLLDNTFHRFMLDAPVEGGDGSAYQLVLTALPETDADVVAFHRSESAPQDFIPQGQDAPHYPLDDFLLFQNGAPESGTLALQYVTRYAGLSVVRAFSLFAAVLALTATAAFVLLFFLKAKLPMVFAATSLLLGLGMLFITPLAGAGQPAYLADAYHYANALAGSQPDPTDALWVRAADQHLLDMDARQTDVFTWQDSRQAAAEKMAAGSDVLLPVQRAGVAFPLYLPQTAGILLTRLLGLNTFWLLLLPRLLNLSLYVFITARALRRMPVAGALMAGIALLPSSLQAALSFSPAALALSASFYLVATCANCAQHRTAIRWQAVAQMLACTAAITLYSPWLAPFALVLFMVPVRQYPSRRYAAVSMALGVLAAVLGGLGSWQSASFSPATLWQGDALWLKSLLAGHWDSPLNWLFLLAALGLAGALAIPYHGGAVLAQRTRAVAGLSAILCLPLAFISGQWLPSLLLLALAGLGGMTLQFRRDITRPLLFSLVAVAGLVQLDAFIIILRG